MGKTTVSSKYQVVIPKAERQRVGLSPGQQLTVRATAGGDIVISQRSVLSAVAGAGTEAWRAGKVTPDQYLQQLREEWQSETAGN